MARQRINRIVEKRIEIMDSSSAEFQSIRVFFLFSVCIILFELFRFLLFFSFLNLETCYTAFEFLDHAQDLGAIQFHFPLVFGLLFLWSLAEFYELWNARRLKSVQAVLLLVAQASIVSVSTSIFMLLEVSKFTGAQGEYNSELFKFFETKPKFFDGHEVWDGLNTSEKHKNWREKSWLRWKEEFPKELPGWASYTWEHTCAKGIEIGSLTKEDWNEMDREFLQMWEDHYAREDYLMAKESLYRLYGIDHSCETDGCPDWHNDTSESN